MTSRKSVLFSKASKFLKCLYPKHLCVFRSTSKTVKKRIDFPSQRTVFKIIENRRNHYIYITFKWFSNSKIGTLWRHSKKTIPGARQALKCLYTKHLVTFREFTKRPIGTRKGSQKVRFTPPQKQIRNRDGVPERAQTLIYITCSGTSEPSRKSHREFGGVAEGPKQRFPKKCSRASFEALQVDIALG